MSKTHTIFGAVAGVLLSISSATAQQNHDFQIPAKFFESDQPSHPIVAKLQSAMPKPKNVPIDCRSDFDWSTNPAQPTQELIERVDTLGFNGGKDGEIAFLRMNDTQREEHLKSLRNPGAKAWLAALADQKDKSALDEREFLEQTLERTHGWGDNRWKQISAECDCGEKNLELR